MEKNKKKRGGVRPNAGRPKKYNCETVTWAFRCPVNELDNMKKYVRAKLKTFKKK